MDQDRRPVQQWGDTALRDALVHWEQVVNTAHAAQAEVMVEMARRARRADAVDRDRVDAGTAPLVPGGAREEFVVDEVAVHLHCTRVAASHRFGTALVAAAHPPLAAAWKAGTIDGRKVQIIGEGLVGTDPVFADALAAQAAEHAAIRTGPEVRRWLARKVITADPGMAEIRRTRAVADRRITVTPLPDGVSELVALLPTIQARQIYDTVNTLAHEGSSDDVRTIDQRRADALIDLLIGRADPPQIHVAVTVPADTLLGKSAEAADVTGVGPITSAEALTLVNGSEHDTVFRRLLTDPETGILRDIAERQYRPSAGLDRAIRARDRVCRFPGCNRPAQTTHSGTDLDHATPWPQGPTSAANLAVLCRHHHRLKHSPGWNAELHLDGTMRWTTPSGHTLTTHPWTYTEPANMTLEDTG